ncbi:MAG: hypothetical protein AAF664_04005 [Planctomycetota bacterium]
MPIPMPATPAQSPDFIQSISPADPGLPPGIRSEETFVDRRKSSADRPDSSERRQFGNSHAGLSEAGRELALAIDQYKVVNHRRYLTCDEMLSVLEDLGYRKDV